MTEFITLTLFGLLMIISPGPDFAIITKVSVGIGRNAGIGAALGIAIANLVHVSLNLFGIGVVVANSETLFTLMKILGAAYLLYIGFKGLLAKEEKRSYAAIKAHSNVSTISRTGFFSGFFTSVLNPKAWLFFLSFFSLLISKETSIPTQVLYGIWICTLAFLWFSLVAIFFTHPIFTHHLKRAKHWIERIAGGALMFLGIQMLYAMA